MDEFRRENKAQWDERAVLHAASSGYATEEIAADPDRLSTVVDFDRRLLGDIAGLDVVHLQCHIGTDTCSLGKLGARVTGLDFSEPAIESARALAARLGLDARFVVSEFYDAPTALAGETFDLVYTGVGALCWLPDIARWAEVVAGLLRPGGRLYLREGHPILWACDHDRADDLLVISEAYFERDEPTTWDEAGTYVEVPEHTEFVHTRSHEWNHGIGEILTAVLDAGLVIETFEEHRFLDWQPWKLFEPVPERPDNYQLPEHRRDRLPLQYTLIARRPN